MQAMVKVAPSSPPPGVIMPGDAYTVKWQQKLEPYWPATALTSIELGPDGIIYAGFVQVVFAINANDGSVAWQYRPEDDGLGPIGIDIDRNGFVVGSFSLETGRLRSVDGNGTQRWERDVGIGQIMTTPVMTNDGGILVGDGRAVRKLDLQGEQIWMNDGVMGGDQFALSVDQAVVYGAETRVTALSTLDGQTIWEFREDPHERIFYSSPVHGPDGVTYVGRQYVTDPSSEIPKEGILALSDKGEKLWSTTDGIGTVTYRPSLSTDGSVLFVGTDSGNLVTLNARDGTILTQTSFKGEASSTPAFSRNGKVVFATFRTPSDDVTTAYAVNVRTGSVIWSREFTYGYTKHVLVVGADDTLYMNGNGFLFAFTRSANGGDADGDDDDTGGSGGGGGGGGSGSIVGLVVIAILAVAAVLAVRHGSK